LWAADCDVTKSVSVSVSLSDVVRRGVGVGVADIMYRGWRAVVMGNVSVKMRQGSRAISGDIILSLKMLG
jgi:hypothetical protein